MGGFSLYPKGDITASRPRLVRGVFGTGALFFGGIVHPSCAAVAQCRVLCILCVQIKNFFCLVRGTAPQTS